MTQDCPKLAELYSQLQTLKSSFDANLTHAQTIIKTKDVFSAKLVIRDAKDKREKMEKVLDEMWNIVNFFEKLINFNEQYETQKSVLTELGDLEKLSNGQLGIKGIDPTDPMNPDKTKEYIFPSKEAIKEKLLANKELYELKIKQGFTRLLITPFALPLDKLADKYGKELVKKFQANGDKLYSAGPNPYNQTTKISNLKTLKLNPKEQILVHHHYKQSDIDGSIKYYPKKFDIFSDGHTKRYILNNPNNPFPGYEITLLLQNPITYIEKDALSPEEYLDLTKTRDRNELHYNTVGQTPEDAINLNRQTLHLTNQIIGDNKGNDKNIYCISAFLDKYIMNNIPCVYWDYNTNKAVLDQRYVKNHSSEFVFRPAVRVL